MTRTRSLGVLALTLAVAVAAAAMLVVSDGLWSPQRLPFTVPWVALTAGYLLVQTFPLEYEIRTETRAYTVTHIPTMVGLVFVPPGLHGLARLASSLIEGIARRKPPTKVAFNAATATLEVAAATLVLAVVEPAPHADLMLWASLMASVIASECLGFLLVQLLMLVLGQRQAPSARWSGLVEVVLASSILGSIGVVFVAAAWTDKVMLILVVLAGAGVLAAYGRHQRLAQLQLRTNDLHRFLQGLGPVDLDTEEGVSLLDHVRQLLHAQELEVSVHNGTAWRLARLSEGTAPLRSLEPSLPVEPAALGSARMENDDQMVTPLLGARGLLGVLTVRGRFGDRRQFGLGDLRLLETIGSELAGAIERGQLQHELALAATTDPLTGLPNLNELSSRLNQALADRPEGLLVAAVAVDSFREVNDTLGHEVGDELLLEVARRLRVTYPEALIGRIGGGRFAVCVLRDAFASDASLFGLGLRAQVEGGAQLGPVGTHIKLSVGCVVAPEHGDAAATLIRRAETAMYSARHAHGGPVIWEPVYEVEGHRRLAVVMALREAVSNGAIGVAYQPKLTTDRRTVAGVEALARWTHPALGAISPTEFIPLAEAAGLMGPLTTSVLRQAVTACKGWQRRAGRIGVSVNVSADTLLDPAFVTEVAALLVAANLSPDLLTLELTEGIVVNDPVLAAQRMQEMRALGVKLSVDDFGTGYSSLTYLKGLPVDEVKIDKGFVDNVTNDHSDRAIVRAVVDIAHAMGLTAVAEGVETPEQLQTLALLGVDEVQGYLLARPMPAVEMARWLRQQDQPLDESPGTISIPQQN